MKRLSLKQMLLQKKWDTLKEWIASGGDINQIDTDQNTVFHLAAKSPSVPLDILVQLMSTHNINKGNKYGQTALHLLVNKRRWDAVPEISKHNGGDINICTSQNITPLHSVVSQQDAPVSLVRQLVSKQNVNVQDRHGRTALHRLVQVNRWDLVPMLIDNGASVDITNDTKHTPLAVGVIHHTIPESIVTPLIPASNINLKDTNGLTILHHACNKARWDIIPLLLKHGANINLQGENKQYPIHYAISASGRSLIPVGVLNQLISKYNINKKQSECSTVLHSHGM